MEPKDVAVGEVYTVALSSLGNYLYDTALVSWTAADFKSYEGRDVRDSRKAGKRSVRALVLHAPRYDIGIDGLEDAYEALGGTVVQADFGGVRSYHGPSVSKVSSLCSKYIRVLVLTSEELEQYPWINK